MTVYTRITSWRVPSEWYPGKQAKQQTFEWSVHVVRKTEQGNGELLVLCPDGPLRTFRWL